MFVLSFGAHIGKNGQREQPPPGYTPGKHGVGGRFVFVEALQDARGRKPTEFGSQDEEAKGESHKEPEPRGVYGQSQRRHQAKAKASRTKAEKP